MSISIDKLLDEIREDKHQNFSTTSFKFKRDLWDFFQHFEDRNAVEFGTHKGQTTRILSFLFNQVITFNLPNHFEEAELLNSDRDNIIYEGLNLYDGTECPKQYKNVEISVFLIDAVHTFDAIMHDFARLSNMKLADEVYLVFDDYGLVRDVYQAVNQLISTGKMTRLQYIGHPPRYSFGGHPERILLDHEGIICKLT